MTDKLNELTAAGVAVWLDDLSRVRLSSGGLDQLRREKHVAGVTTNPTIFAKALSDADEYNWQLRDLATRGIEVEESVRMLTTYDVRWACDVMRPSYDGSQGVDGRVSIEVDPRVAHDSDRTVAEAKALWWLVDRPNLFIKIPATEEGLSAITDTLAEGISVNVTLIFGLDRYSAVMEAFLAGLEQAKANGHDLSTIGSVASFFVSRVDAEVDKRLEKIGSEQAKSLRGKAAVANAQLAYERYTEVFSSDRWKALADAGAHPQRPLWASTSTKKPGLPRHHLRRGADRPRHGQHHAGVGHPRVRRSRRDPRRHHHQRLRRGSQGLRGPGGGRGGHVRRDRHAGARGRGEVRGQLAGAARGRPQVAGGGGEG